MNLRVCNAEEFFNNELGFFKVFESVRMNSISAVGKFTDCSFVEIFDYFVERYCFDLIESVRKIDCPFDNKLPQHLCLNNRLMHASIVI